MRRFLSFLAPVLALGLLSERSAARASETRAVSATVANASSALPRVPAPAQPGSSCVAQWLGTFDGVAGIGPSQASVSAVAVFDDGSGPELYVAGSFDSANGAPVRSIAKWDGTSLSEVGGGVAGYVDALAVFDDGSGPALYAAGRFISAGGVPANRVARWDGSGWSAVGAGLGFAPSCLHVHDDGGGPELYAGGTFTSPTTYIARWDGTSWSTVGGGLGGAGFGTWGVFALATFDDGSGSGPALFAAGHFSSADGNAVTNIARWDGTSWSPVASGLTGSVSALTAFDPGSGATPTLVAGGDITAASGLPVHAIAQWDGTSWSALGSGVTGGSEIVTGLHVHDDGLGSPPLLFAGGNFTNAGGMPAVNVAAWNGTTWSALSTGVNRGATAVVKTFASFDDGNGPGAALFVGGLFTTAGSLEVNGIASYRAPSWSALGGAQAFDSTVRALVVHDDGQGGRPALYAGGEFTRVGGVAASRIARWDGVAWSALGTGMEPSAGIARVQALAVYDDGRGGGSELYAGGSFDAAGGVPASNIARWDGSAWSALGAGIAGDVLALAVYDAGGGPELYAGGQFQTAGGTQATRIARWDGLIWRNVGTGVGGGPQPSVRTLLVHDDGGGPALFAGGRFLTAGGIAANNIARWNGAAWSTLGGGTNHSVEALAVYDAGLGDTLLFASGEFTAAGGVPASYVARWDGSGWSAAGSGTSSIPYALAAYDDGSGAGPALYAGGQFSAGGYLRRWNGTSWDHVDGDLEDTVYALVVHDAAPIAGGADLYVGGAFRVSTGGDSYLARYGGCRAAEPGSAYCFGDGSGTACPCGNAGATGEGCANSTGSGATLGAHGSTSVSSDDLAMDAANLLPNQPALLFAGSLAVNGGDGIVFGDGLRCAGVGVVRLGVQTPDALGEATWGPGLNAIGEWRGGETRRFQAWYRNPTGSPCGSGFNLSNGYEVFFTP